ncbi:MAG: hypothetical protein LBG23_00840 [Endomicrobium sp.]|nr:hypothetical protein [Endomicrobium sp.]
MRIKIWRLNIKVIVLEGFTSAVDVELDWSRIVKNNIGLKMSKNKIESIMVSAPKINWLELIIGDYRASSLSYEI